MSETLAKIRVWGAIAIGGIVLLAMAVFRSLDALQQLDYIQAQWPKLYLFIVSPRFLFVGIVVAIIMFAIAIWQASTMPRSSSPTNHPPASSPPIQITNSPTYHNSPTISPAINQAASNSNVVAINPTPYTATIKPIGDPEITQICDAYEAFTDWYLDCQSQYLGLLGKFSNPPPELGKKSCDIEDVVAHVTYTTSDGRRITANGVWWLNKKTRQIDFAPGEIRQLIILLIKDTQVLAVENGRTQVPFSRRGQLPAPMKIKTHLIGGTTSLPLIIEIIFIDRNRTTVCSESLKVVPDIDKVVRAVWEK